MVKGLSQMQAHLGACTILEWTGGGTGPMFLVQNSDGDVWEYLNFDGTLGPDKIAAGTHLDVLIKHNRSGAGNGALFHHYKNCTFFQAERLFYAAGGSSGVGTAEFTFSKCMFNCGESDLTQWTSQAFFSDNPQCVNTVFDSNCEFNNCAYCAKVENTGRISFDHPTVTICGTILHRTGGSQNINGDRILFPHLDGGGGDEGRKALYKSVNGTSTHGPVVIETPKYGSLGATSDEFATITSYVDTSLTLTHPLRMRVGDKVAFFRKTDLPNADGGKKEATIATRFSDTFYSTSEDADTLGFVGDIEDNYYAANGEALVTCVSSEFVHFRNAHLSPEHIWGGRLARLTSSAHSGGRCPKFHGQNIMADWDVDFNESGIASLFTLSGTAWWRMENTAETQGTSEPITVGNFGVFSGGGSGDTFNFVAEDRVIMREYAQSGIEMFVLRSPSTGLPVSGLSFVAGDAKVYQDGALVGNTTSVPITVGGGVYAISLTVVERTGQQIFIMVKDQTSPAAWMPVTLMIDAYGHVNARHKLNLNETSVKANLTQIGSASEGADRLKRSAESMSLITVGSGSTVSTVVTSSISPAVTTTDQLKHAVLAFARDTTTVALRGKRTDITGSSAGGVLTVSPALPTPPVSGDLATAI